MSNHPWRASSHGFSCPPNCPKRKPGCQDHCDKYANDKASWDATRKKQAVETCLDRYVADHMTRYRDKRRN